MSCYDYTCLYAICQDLFFRKIENLDYRLSWARSTAPIAEGLAEITRRIHGFRPASLWEAEEFSIAFSGTAKDKTGQHGN